jgi:hypothetical protein
MNFTKVIVWLSRAIAIWGTAAVIVDGFEKNAPLPETGLKAVGVFVVIGLFSWLVDRAFKASNKAPKQEIPRNLKVISLWVVGASFAGWLFASYTHLWWVGAITAAILLIIGFVTTYGTPPKKRGD